MEKPDEQSEGPLLDYATPPTRWRVNPRAKSAIFKIVLPVTVGASAVGMAWYAIVGGSINKCRGATRSARLMWEQRQAEVDRAVAEQSLSSWIGEEPHD